MLGYIEVVCLIWGPMLASQSCLHAFCVLTSIHLLSLLLKMLFIILVIIIVAFMLTHCNLFIIGVFYYYKLTMRLRVFEISTILLIVTSIP